VVTLVRRPFWRVSGTGVCQVDSAVVAVLISRDALSVDYVGDGEQATQPVRPGGAQVWTIPLVAAFQQTLGPANRSRVIPSLERHDRGGGRRSGFLADGA
jgi:hypothetical protein